MILVTWSNFPHLFSTPIYEVYLPSLIVVSMELINQILASRKVGIVQGFSNTANVRKIVNSSRMRTHTFRNMGLQLYQLIY